MSVDSPAINPTVHRLPTADWYDRLGVAPCSFATQPHERDTACEVPGGTVSMCMALAIPLTSPVPDSTDPGRDLYLPVPRRRNLLIPCTV